MRLTTSPPSRAECHEILDPKPPGTLGATPGLLRDSFTFTFLFFIVAGDMKANFFVRTLSIRTLLKLTCIHQYKHKASLRVHCRNCYSNVSQFYVIRTLPIVFFLCTSLAIFPIIPAFFPQIYTVFSLSFSLPRKKSSASCTCGCYSSQCFLSSILLVS